ncbi:MAG: FAD-dependent oxidoreductase [Thermodesulfobacteriota bacterium]
MLKFDLQHRKTDVLIIGAGGAGSRAAIEAARAGKEVALVCRSPLGKGGLTPTANGGYHAALWPGDSPAIHGEDLTTMGCFLNDRNLVRVLTEEAAEEARRLEELGAKVDWKIPPKPAEPQMRYPRSLFVPGKEILDAFRHHLKNQNKVQLLEDHLAIQLLTKDGEVTGAILLDIREGGVVVYESKATVLATGSLGEIYPLTAHEPMGLPTGSTGSGYVLAGWAGADLVDMEMIQFTVMPVVPPLISGMRCLPWAPLFNRDGKEFLPPDLGAYSHEAALAVCRELEEGRGPITMDLRGKNASEHGRHPVAAHRGRRLKELGVTPYQRAVEIGMGVLFMMGGVHINERCETSVPGLYACGEVAGNVHGARRVSGNAFPEMIVFGARAGRYAAAFAEKKKASPEAPKDQVGDGVQYLESLVQGEGGKISPMEVGLKVKSIMGSHVHMVRNRGEIILALQELRELEKELPSVGIEPVAGLRCNARLLEAIDVRWIVHTAQIVCQGALLREESRGFHFREDFPQEDADWLKHTVVRREGVEWVSGTKPVVM